MTPDSDQSPTAYVTGVQRSVNSTAVSYSQGEAC
jgi:hypothetical protein